MTTARAILVVDDDPAIRELVREFLTDGRTTVLEAMTGADALVLASRQRPDLVLLDMRLPDVDGLEVLGQLRANSDLPVVVITADSSSSRTIRAIQAGAYDYLVKPLEPETVQHTVGRALEHRRLSEEVRELQEMLAGRDVRERIVGGSPSMQAVYKLIGRVADSNAPVLITGETGTGKELVAETLHQNSRRKRGPLVRVNCAALPETLLESELFGHERGAFTGAVARRKGRFELADGGTIFLDEIAELNLGTQKKLLRALQFGQFERVGGAATVQVDARVLAATNRDLAAALAEGSFREDLYYRLNVIRIELPPLRERREDIPALVAHFLSRYRAAPDAPPTKISAEAMAVILSGDWPGNIRQLENTIQRAVVLSGGRVITPEVLDVDVPAAGRGNLDVDLLVRDGVPLKRVLADVERAMIVEALRQSGGNRSEAARRLHIYRRMLYQKMEEYGLG
jgi:two-component system response regulator AtoC